MCPVAHGEWDVTLVGARNNRKSERREICRVSDGSNARKRKMRMLSFMRPERRRTKVDKIISSLKAKLFRLFRRGRESG
jgi:hypothetical protein